MRHIVNNKYCKLRISLVVSFQFQDRLDCSQLMAPFPRYRIDWIGTNCQIIDIHA